MRAAAAGPGPGEPARTGRLPRSPWPTLVIMSAGLFLAVLSTTVVSVALPTIGASLHASATGLEWIVDAYVLAYAALLVAGGVAGDRFGRTGAFLTGVAVFGLGSLAAGLAPATGLLIAARVGQGIGPALLIPASLALVRSVFTDPRQRTIAFGLWSTSSGVAMAVGPALGGVIVDGLGWRWVFLLNVPLAGLVLAAGTRWVPRLARQGGGPFDWAGALMSVAGLGLLAFGVIEGQARGWTAPEVIAAFAAAAALLAGFVQAELHLTRARQEARATHQTAAAPQAAAAHQAYAAQESRTPRLTRGIRPARLTGQVAAGLPSARGAPAGGAGSAPEPAREARPRFRLGGRGPADAFVPVDLFARPAFALANLAALTVFFAFVGAIVYFSAFFQQAQGRSPAAAGLAVGVLGVAYAAVAAVSGRLVSRLGERRTLLAGLIISGLATLTLVRLEPATSLADIWWNFALLGGGIGLCGTPMTTLALSQVEAARAGMASAVLNASRQLGQVFGVAVLGALVYGYLPGSAAAGPLDPAQRELLAAGLHNALAVAGAALLGTAAVIGCWAVLAVRRRAPRPQSGRAAHRPPWWPAAASRGSRR